jgi:putative FmdB family regulatory protein
MPIFEYRCLQCQSQFEELVSSSKSEEIIVCPVCGSEKTARLLSSFAVSGTEKSSGISAPGSSSATTSGCGSGGFS